MSEVCQKVASINTSSSPSDDYIPEKSSGYIANPVTADKEASLDKEHDMMSNVSKKLDSQESLNVSIDSIPYPAYMINYECGLVWLNNAAQQSFFMNTSIPDRAEDRSVIPKLLEWAKSLGEADKEILFKSISPFGYVFSKSPI